MVPLEDYISFCRYLDDVSINSNDKKKQESKEKIFFVTYNKNGITLFPIARKHYSQNNSMLPMLFLEYQKENKSLKISARSYIGIAFNLFLLLFMILAI